MQGIATWLVARPQNAVMALVVTLLLPAPQFTSGAIMVLLVLALDRKLVLVEALVAAAVLAAIWLILGFPLASMLALLVGTWIPVMLLAMLLMATRSLTLTLQVSVIIALLALLGFGVVVADPAAFWQPYLTRMAELFEQSGLQLNTDLISAEVMTVSAVLAYWMLYCAGLLLGYAAYKLAVPETEDFGRFRDLNFGRVIAFTFALASLLALVSGAAWLQNVAFVLFAVFMLQGLAIVHWLRAEYGLPVAALVAVYVLLPLLQILLVMALALIGYGDAWFDFRRRIKKA